MPAIELKDELAAWLREAGHEVIDLGTNGADSVDYPDYGAHARRRGRRRRGRARHRRVRLGHRHLDRRQPQSRPAAARWSPSRCRPRLAREHNDANVIAMGARLIGTDMAKACVAAFLATDFAGGRHQRRVDKLSNPLAGHATDGHRPRPHRRPAARLLHRSAGRRRPRGRRRRSRPSSTASRPRSS